MSLSCRDPVVLFQTHKTYAPANYDIISPDCVLFEAIMLINYDIVSGILRKTFCEIWNEIQHFLFKKMNLNIRRKNGGHFALALIS